MTSTEQVWIRWFGTKLSHRVVVAGSDQYNRTCFRTRCGRRLYARETTPADEKQPRCHVCARRPMVKSAGVAPPVATWSNVRRFDLTDTEEL